MLGLFATFIFLFIFKFVFFRLLFSPLANRVKVTPLALPRLLYFYTLRWSVSSPELHIVLVQVRNFTDVILHFHVTYRLLWFLMNVFDENLTDTGKSLYFVEYDVHEIYQCLYLDELFLCVFSYWSAKLFMKINPQGRSHELFGNSPFYEIVKQSLV